MILIRCDANTDIGAGHFFRQLAMAEAAQDRGHRVQMVMNRPPQAFVDIAARSGVAIDAIDVEPGSQSDARALGRLADTRSATAVIIDGYHFEASYFEALNTDRRVVVAVDDLADRRFPVDILVNVNPNAHELVYRLPPHARTLLGVRYTMLRRQFRKLRRATQSTTTNDDVQNLLIMLGGGDATNETTKVVEALRIAEYDGRADVIVGPANPHIEAIEQAAGLLAADVDIHRNVSDMARLMANKDLAICAGGHSIWELACLGIPAMQIIVADNQREIVANLDARAVAYAIGEAPTLTPAIIANHFRHLNNRSSLRTTMSRRSMELIDGRGALRVVDAICES